MLRRFTRGQVIFFIAGVVLVIILLFAISKTISYVNSPVEEIQNQNVEVTDFTLNINGDYLTYVEINDEYIEEGAVALNGEEDISDDIIISYYDNGSQVSSIDTRSIGSYTVKYEVSNKEEVKTALRTVIVTDDIAPSISVPDAITITSSQIATFNVEDGVVVTDNSGVVSFECNNTLSTIPGDYVITCQARDASGNESSRNRLIKVVSGIEFEYEDSLTINYPINENYTYMYSLDNGETWQEASSQEILNIESGNVIALVLEDGNYVMSSTYYLK